MNKKALFSIIIVILALIAIALFKGKKEPLPLKQPGVSSPSGLIKQAKDLEAKNSILEARDIYQRLINESPNSAEVMNWQKKAEELNVKALFSPEIIPDKSVAYEIKSGDTLIKIARQFGTTPELIMKSNSLSDDKIFPGKKIRIWTAPFNIVVDKSQNTLILKSRDDIIKTYIVSTGANNSTPVGNFKIVNKLQNPTWYKAGAVVPASSPENVLGSRWLGFDLAGYGIHGTTDPQSLGKQVTQGCVRMSNSDVEELYAIIPAGVEVTIVD